MTDDAGRGRLLLRWTAARLDRNTSAGRAVRTPGGCRNGSAATGEPRERPARHRAGPLIQRSHQGGSVPVPPRPSGPRPGLTYDRAMDDQASDIVILDRRIAPDELARLVTLFFEDMVKYVVDLDREIAAVGGQLHADAEQLLLASGSRQADLWGANYYPGRGKDECIEYTSLINIRPAQGNRSMLIADLEIRARVRALTFDLLGEGEPLP
jgi:hypothetical protein